MIDFRESDHYSGSFMESKIKSILEKHEIEFYREVIFENLINPKTNKELRFDFYLPHQNILIEYDGLEYHKSSDSKYRDGLKDKFALEYNFDLHRLQGYESLELFFLEVMNIDPTEILQKAKKRRKKSEKYDKGSYINYYNENISDYIEAAIKDPEKCYEMALRARTNTTWWFYNIISGYIPQFKKSIKISHLISTKNIIINSLRKNPPKRIEPINSDGVRFFEPSEDMMADMLADYGKQFEKQ